MVLVGERGPAAAPPTKSMTAVAPVGATPSGKPNSTTSLVGSGSSSSSSSSSSSVSCWEALPPNTVTRVIMGFFKRADLLKAIQVCQSWKSILLLDEVCEDLAAGTTIYRDLAGHVKHIQWKDPERSLASFLNGYRRAVRHGRDLERWWTRYKITFCLSIPPLVGRGGPATCWSVEDCTWRWETGLLGPHGFGYNVSAFSVNNWLSIPTSPPIERLITSPDTSFFTEATLIDKATGRFAKLYACSDRDVAMGREVDIETLAANDGVSSVGIKECYKRVASKGAAGVRVRLRYTFTAYDWTEDSVRLKCTACHLDMQGINNESATTHDTDNSGQQQALPPQVATGSLAAAVGGGGGGAKQGSVGGGWEDDEEEKEEEESASWMVLKQFIEGLRWL